MAGFSFVRVTPSYYGVVAAPVDEIWAVVKSWTPSRWINECGGVPVQFHVLTGETGEQVGCTRASVVGEGVVVEQLVAVDAEEHYMSWKVISDPRSINPFPGSFLNYVNTIRFTGCTDGKQTIAQWEGSFHTDWDMAATMEGILSGFYHDALASLERQLIAARAPPPRLQDASAHRQPEPATVRTLQNAFGSSFR